MTQREESVGVGNGRMLRDRKKTVKRENPKAIKSENEEDQKPFIRKRKFEGASEAEGGKGPVKIKREKNAYEHILNAEGKPDWKKMRVAQKNLKETRKKREMKPEMYEMTKEAKVIWEELRKDSCPQNVREKLCTQLHDLVKNHIKRLSFAHDTVRVLECLLTYGTESIRKNVHVAFAAKEDLLYLMKQKYGHYLALKLMKYAEKEQRDAMFKAMETQIVQLIRHQYASRVLNEFYSSPYSKAVQKDCIIKECYSPMFRNDESVRQLSLKEILAKYPEQKPSIMQHLEELITLMTDKNLKNNSILHMLMHEYVENSPATEERAELIDTMKEELVNILHTPEGSLLSMSCVWHSPQKTRKAIVKSFKTFIPKIACDKNGYRVLLAIIDAVDDTVLLSKAICSELLNNVNEIVLNQYGQRVVAYLLSHRSPLFFDPGFINVLAQGDGNEHTKKPIIEKLNNVIEPVKDDFLGAIVDNFGMWVKDNGACLVTKFILENCSGEKLDDALEMIATTIMELPTTEGIERTAVEGLTKFILGSLSSSAKLCFATKIMDSPQGTLKQWLQTNRGCFLILRIFEACEGNSELKKKVTDLVKKNAAVIKKNSKSAGGKLLLQKTVGV